MNILLNSLEAEPGTQLGLFITLSYTGHLEPFAKYFDVTSSATSDWNSVTQVP